MCEIMEELERKTAKIAAAETKMTIAKRPVRNSLLTAEDIAESPSLPVETVMNLKQPQEAETLR